MAAQYGQASMQAVFQGNNPPYTDAQVVNLAGGAGVDWTPATYSQTRALMIGTAGNLKCDTAAGSIGVVIPVQVGEFRISVTKVYSTTDGTTAASIVAMF